MNFLKQNPVIAKKIVKAGAGLLISAFIGYTVKFGKRIDESIDDYYEDKIEEKKAQDN